MNDKKTFEVDGTRPIESGDIEVADTFEEDGTRPIAESPDFLVRNDFNDRENRPKSSDSSDTNTEEKPSVDNNKVEVVDTFEADGTRPIMSNKYEVVDTLDIDGERPITSESNIK